MSENVYERLFDVRGTRIVVTGSASGLGFAMAEVLAECGARVTLADVAENRLEASTEPTIIMRGSLYVAWSHKMHKADNNHARLSLRSVVA